MHRILHHVAAGWLLASAAASAGAVTLYDGSLGTLPSAQGWTPLVAGAGAAQSVAGGAYRLDTTGAGVSVHGNGRLSPLLLDTAAGFDLGFTLRIESEAHASSNRAGYSVLLVGADPTHALEVGFWAGNVWAYDHDLAQPDRFVHGLDAVLDTTLQHSYLLAVRDQQYTLSADGRLLFGGTLHDYTQQGAPYTQPNFVFFGDDTSRGASVSALSFVALTPVPESRPAVLLLAGLAALAWGRCRR